VFGGARRDVTRSTSDRPRRIDARGHLDLELRSFDGDDVETRKIICLVSAGITRSEVERRGSSDDLLRLEASSRDFDPRSID